MKCEVINTESKMFIIYWENYGKNFITVATGTSSKVYANFSEMPLKEYLELRDIKHARITSRQR